MDRNFWLAITVSVLALVQRLADFQSKPLAVILMAGVVIFWGMWLWKWRRPKTSPFDISVVEFAVHNALNLKIANRSEPAGYGGVELMLHRLRKWNSERNEYRVVERFTPLTIYADDVDLPYGVERMFQILNFVDFSQPEIHGKLKGSMTRFPVGAHGIWCGGFELRWAGGNGIQIVKHFRLDGTSKPYFCDAKGVRTGSSDCRAET